MFWTLEYNCLEISKKRGYFMKSSVLKKAVSLFLVIVLAFTAVVPSFAAEPEAETVEPQEKAVARFTLFSTIYFFPVAGHEWIYVENLTDEPMQVGLYTVPAGEGVSVGCFSFSVSDGWGLYYNVEAYRENRDDNIDNCWSITQYLTQSEVEKLSRDLKNYPNMWSFYFNCMFFAFSIWNSNSDDFLIPLVIPVFGQLQVILNGGQKGVAQMYYPRPDQQFKQEGTGSSARLVHVSEETLNHS